MKFKVGQEVLVRENNGPLNWQRPTEYYHGGDLRMVPLGAKAVIGRIYGQDKMYVRFENRNHGRNGGWYLHPTEIGVNPEQEQQAKVASFLEDILFDNTPVAEELLVTETENGYKNNQPPKGLIGRIKHFFGYGLVQERKLLGKPFEPSFNAREEFAVWIRQEFPELWEYAVRNQEYTKLTERKDEVLEGARMAYEHAMETSNSCVRSSFECRFSQFEKCNTKNFPRDLNSMITWIEEVSANLGETTHYGTEVVRR